MQQRSSHKDKAWRFVYVGVQRMQAMSACGMGDDGSNMGYCYHTVRRGLLLLLGVLQLVAAG